MNIKLLKCAACLHKDVEELSVWSKLGVVYERFVFIRYFLLQNLAELERDLINILNAFLFTQISEKAVVHVNGGHMWN